MTWESLLMKEKINHPDYYNAAALETIDAIEGLGCEPGFSIGSVIKYITRYQHKGSPLTDLRKAKWYIDRLIQYEEKKLEDKR